MTLLNEENQLFLLTDPPIRLVSNQTSLTGISGIPQLHYFDAWHNICDTGFDEKDGEVACRELGLQTQV